MRFFLRDRIRSEPVFALVAVLSGLIGISIIKDLVLLCWSSDREIQFMLDYFGLRVEWSDSWRPIYEAVNVFLSDSGRGIYRSVFYEQRTKFQYPPTSLLPFIVLSEIGLDAKPVIRFLQLLSFTLVICMVFIIYKILLLNCTNLLSENSAANTRKKLALFVTITVGTLSFYPIMIGHALGQIQVYLDFLICLSLLAWIKQRKVISGAMLGLAALVKPQFALILVWSIMRKEKQFTRGVVCVSLPIITVSLIVFGISEHLDYLSVLSYIGSHGEVYWPNQSMNGLLNRLYSDVDPLVFQLHSYAPYSRVVYVGTLVSTFVIVTFSLVFRPSWVHSGLGSAKKDESFYDISTMLVALTIASPVAWEHHYGVVWPIFVVAFLSTIKKLQTDFDRTTFITLCMLSVSYLLVSNFFTAFSESFSSPPLNLVQSYIYFGGLLLLTSIIGLRILIKPKDAEVWIDG